MQEIVFPKLYEYFGSLGDIKHTDFYSHTFQSFQFKLVIPSFLVIDKFLEDGSLGNDWENLFLKTINEMAEIVLYNPETIDYSVTSKSQEMFEHNIAMPVCEIIYQHCRIWENMQFDSTDEDSM